MTELSITGGADDLQRVGKALKDAGAKDLRNELLRRLRDEGKASIVDVRAAARRELPKRGGLADLIGGSKFATRTKVSGTKVGARVEGTSGKHKLEFLDQGTVKHPVYGRGKWVTQTIRTGWFSETLEGHAPRIRRGMQETLADVAARIEAQA